MNARTDVVLAVCFTAAVACHGSHGTSAEQRVRSDNLTAAAVTSLLAGSEDYAALRGQLVEAVAANRDNADARLFLGVVTALAAASADLAPDGALQQLLQRGGLLQTGAPGSLWTFGLRLEDHGQGVFKDSTPTLGEIQSYVHDTMRPALAALLTVLDAVPPEWEYVIPAASGGLLLQRLAPGQQIDLRLDYGDVQLAAAIGHGVQAVFDLLRVVDWDDLAPNALDGDDDPNLDVLEVIRANYPNLGRLAHAGDLLVARDRIRTAFQAYGKAAAHIRAETTAQQAAGVVTLGRGTFGDEQATQQFLAAEARVRDLVGSVIDRFWVDQIVRFDTNVLTGEALPLADQVEIDFFRFFQGLDLRATYFKTIVDPFTGKRALGVGSLDELTAAMATFGDVLVSVGGAAPGAGDLQELMYRVRVDAPPNSTKVMNGIFTDWATDAVQVLVPPTTWVGHPTPDLGAVEIAVDANALYLRQTRDLLPVLTAPGDTMEFTFTGPSGYAFVRYVSGIGFELGSDYSAGIIGVQTPQGMELRIGLGNGTGQWARLERTVRMDNGLYVIDVDPEPVFIKVR